MSGHILKVIVINYIDYRVYSIAIVYCYEHLLDLYTSMRGHQRYKYNQPMQIDIGCNDSQSIGLMWADCYKT